MKLGYFLVEAMAYGVSDDWALLNTCPINSPIYNRLSLTITFLSSGRIRCIFRDDPVSWLVFTSPAEPRNQPIKIHESYETSRSLQPISSLLCGCYGYRKVQRWQRRMWRGFVMQNNLVLPSGRLFCWSAFVKTVEFWNKTCLVMLTASDNVC